MTAIEMEQTRRELIREILNTESLEMLEAVKKAIHRISKRTAEKAAENWPSIGPHTREEMLARIAESEAAEAAGEMYTTDEVRRYLEQKYPFLCK